MCGWILAKFTQEIKQISAFFAKISAIVKQFFTKNYQNLQNIFISKPLKSAKYATIHHILTKNGTIMSIQICPIQAFNDNYIWLLINEKNREVIAIDVGDETPVVNFLQQNNLNLSAIWITHHHDDHTAGVANLLKNYPNAHVFTHKNHGLNNQIASENLTNIDENDNLSAWQYSAKVWQTFGHTDSHLSFLLNMDEKLHVFCGDTLFCGGCGRVFTGTIEQLFDSFKRLNALPDDTLFYPAHEYTLSNLKFAESLEPDDKNIVQFIQQCQTLRQQNQPTLPTTLAQERLINPFVKAVNGLPNSLIDGVKNQMPLADLQPLTLFSALRQLKNNF